MKRLLLVIIGLVVLVVQASSVSAAIPPKITVTPFLQEVRIGAEPTKNFDITLTNDSNQPQKLALSVADFGSLDLTGGVAFVGSGAGQLLDKYALSKWLVLNVNTLSLAAHQSKKITATIINDSQLKPGGHYAAIVATVLSPSGQGQANVSLKQKISSLVLAIKTGGEKYDLSLQNIDSNGNLFKLPTEAYLTIKATGNVHVVPRGIVYLKSGSKVIAKGVINQESGYVLPGTTRAFTVQLDKLTSANFWNTAYKLQVDYRYDGIDRYASKSASVTYINSWWLIIVIVLAVTIRQLVTRLRRRKN